MELTGEQKKKAWLILGVVAVVVALLLLVHGLRLFIGARIPAVPGLSESIIGGRLKSDVLHEGTNSLEFTAKISDGGLMADTVTFKVLPPGPYGPYDILPPDPYGSLDPSPPGPY